MEQARKEGIENKYTRDLFRIKVARQGGTLIILEAYNEIKIINLKQAINGKVGIPASQQRLLFNDKELQDDTTLQQNCIGK